MKSHRIKFVKGALLGQEFLIGEAPMIVGRSRGSDIRIPDEIEFQDVSRTHVMLVNQGEALLVVNMSSHTTEVNGREMPLNHKMQLASGMSVVMGASTEFRVLEPADESFEIRSDETQDEEEKDQVPSGKTQATIFGTSAGVAKQDAQTSAPTNVPSNGQTGELTGPLTGALEGDEDESEDAQFIADEEEPADEKRQDGKAAVPETGTVAGETVLISPEELVALIEANRKAKLLKTYKRVGIFVGGFLALAIAYLCMRPHPETELTWPKRGDGRFDDAQLEFKTILGDRAVGALCPHDSRTSVRASSNGVTIVDTYIGRDRDVPLRLKLVCEKNRDNLKKSRNQLFDEKRRKLEEAGGWNFLAISPVGFLGPNNGVPYREVQYLRSEKNSAETLQWFGHLIFAVHGDCALTFTREIPAVEQWRGGTFLARETMLLFGDQIINGHWEGRPDFRDEPVESMLAEADGLLARRTPLLWKDAEFLLQSVMIKSGGSGVHFDEALKRLMKLRGDQRIEFERLKALAYKEKAFRKTDKDSSPALDEALRVFSSPDDKRNVLLKKGKWE